jgi:hypothetical protein
MDRLTVVIVAAGLALAACDPDPRSPAVADDPSPTAPSVLSEAQIYSAVIRRLVTKDHTFGRAQSPFKHVYVVDGSVPRAGNVMAGLRPAPEPFPPEVKQAITERLSSLPPLEFISHPGRVRLGPEGIGGVRNAGVIISLSPIERGKEKLKVGTGLWCGGTCGQWVSYLLTRQGGRWKITRTACPCAIA